MMQGTLQTPAGGDPFYITGCKLYKTSCIHITGYFSTFPDFLSLPFILIITLGDLFYITGYVNHIKPEALHTNKQNKREIKIVKKLEKIHSLVFEVFGQRGFHFNSK